MRIIFAISLFLCFLCSTVFALTPPPMKDQQLCYVQGKILSHQKEEAVDAAMNKIQVDTITLRIHDAAVFEEMFDEGFCERMAGDAASDKQKINTFRLCDTTDAADGEDVNGIVGRSLGGGPYCIEKIELLSKDD